MILWLISIGFSFSTLTETCKKQRYLFACYAALTYFCWVTLPVNLDPYISELLYTNDCVIIPGLGGFVANARGAFLSPAHHTFAPPAKRIAFNASLRVSDGLLATHLTQALNITYGEAQTMIQQYVDQLLNELHQGNTVTINRVGSLLSDKEKNLQFEPDQQVNYLTSSFGLSLVHSPSIRRDESRKNNVRNIRDKKPKQRNRQSWRLLELVPAAAVLALLFFNPRVVNDLNTGLANINPFNGLSGYRHYEPIKPRAVKTYTPVVSNANADTQIVSEITPADTTSVAEPSVNADTLYNRVDLEGKYLVVGGCFREMDNAVRFKDQAIADGFTADITGTSPGGLHVVALYAGNDYQQALHELSLIRDKYVQTAWLMKK